MRRTKKLKYRVAVIGCGAVGVLYGTEKKRPTSASHAGAAVSNTKTVLAALVDTDAKALARAGELFPGVKRYASAGDCIKKESPDMVVIATPPSARLALIKLCVQHTVRAIICEKPLANTAREARSIARAIAKSRALFVLNYQRRFSPLFERVRRDIASGALGRVEQVTCYYSNGLYNNGGHALDALLQLLGEDMAVNWARVNKNASHPPGDPCVDAMLETKKGVRIVLQSVDQKAYGIFDIRLLGTRGERAFTDYGSTLMETAARTSVFEGVRQLDRRRALQRRADPQGTLAYAVACLEQGTPPASGVKNGVQVMELLEKIQTYAQKNK